MTAQSTCLAPSTTITPRPTVYLVAWTGGKEQPTFASFTEPVGANETYCAWVSTTRDHNDRVTLIEQAVCADGVVINTTLKDFHRAFEIAEEALAQ